MDISESAAEMQETHASVTPAAVKATTFLHPFPEAWDCGGARNACFCRSCGHKLISFCTRFPKLGGGGGARIASVCFPRRHQTKIVFAAAPRSSVQRKSTEHMLLSTWRPRAELSGRTPPLVECERERAACFESTQHGRTTSPRCSRGCLL